MTNNTKRIASLLAAGVVLTSAGATTAHAESPAPTSETVTEEQQTSEIKYVVKEGDTLGKIAERYLGCSDFYPLIAKVNGICNPNKISVGQVLIIPSLNDALVYEPVVTEPVQQQQPCPTPNVEIPENVRTYVVKAGDTLSCIVRTQYGLTGAKLAKAVDQLATFYLNDMWDPNLISEGQVIYLPDLETLLSIVPNDYTDRYNELADRIAAQERAKHCPGWVNPCWEYVGPCGNIIYVYPGCPVPAFPDPFPPEQPEHGCHGPRLTLHP